VETVETSSASPASSLVQASAPELLNDIASPRDQRLTVPLEELNRVLGGGFVPGSVLLVAGTLVGAPDWALLCGALDHPDDEPVLRARTVSCGEIARRPIEPAAFAAALGRRLEEAL
jgi:hypothetical protein